MLFYVNGCIQGLVSLIEWFHPGYFVKKQQNKHMELDPNVLFYSKLFSPLCIGMSVASILMEKQPNNTNKQVFALGWLTYHSSIVADRIFNTVKTGNLQRKDSFLVHSLLMIGFIRYLKTTNFDYKMLILQHKSHLSN